MTLMSDTLKRGITFDGVTGLKTGANLEDLVTRSHLTSGSQLLDQSSLEDYADGSLVDDYGAALRRARIKAGGVTAAMLADDAFWGGPSLMTTIFGSAAGAAAAINYSGTWTTPPTAIANIFDGDSATYWTEARVGTNALCYWDLGALYFGKILVIGDVRTSVSESARMSIISNYTGVTPVYTLNSNDDYAGFILATTTLKTGAAIKNFYGRYVGMTFSGTGAANVWNQIRRFEVYGRAV